MLALINRLRSVFDVHRPSIMIIDVKPKFHSADLPETSPHGEVSGKSAEWNLGLNRGEKRCRATDHY